MPNWVVIEPSAPRASGTYSSAAFFEMTTPAAWIEAWRGSPSSRLDMSIKWRTLSSPS